MLSASYVPAPPGTQLLCSSTAIPAPPQATSVFLHAVWLFEGYLTSLSLCVILCKVGIMWSTLQGSRVDW